MCRGQGKGPQQRGSLAHQRGRPSGKTVGLAKRAQSKQNQRKKKVSSKKKQSTNKKKRRGGGEKEKDPKEKLDRVGGLGPS